MRKQRLILRIRTYDARCQNTCPLHLQKRLVIFNLLHIRAPWDSPSSGINVASRRDDDRTHCPGRTRKPLSRLCLIRTMPDNVPCPDPPRMVYIQVRIVYFWESLTSSDATYWQPKLGTGTYYAEGLNTPSYIQLTSKTMQDVNPHGSLSIGTAGTDSLRTLVSRKIR